MKIYFYANPEMRGGRQKTISRIISFLKASGVTVFSDSSPSMMIDQDLENAQKTGQMMISQIDAVIIEGTVPSFESGHILALSIASKKPILYFVQSKENVDVNLAALEKDKVAGKYLTIEKYAEKDIETKIIHFLSTTEKGEIRQIPNIKFTLRITQKIERYLQWKARKFGFTKADFLRNAIEEMIESDPEYKAKK